jgi:TonB family protein
MKTNFTSVLAIVIFVLLFGGTALSQSDSNKNVKAVKDSPLKIKKKPFASRMEECGDGRGTTTLKVTFDKSAKVTNVEMISSSGCAAFDRSAIKAAGKIKFKPAIKNGAPFTVVKTATYTFGTY